MSDDQQTTTEQEAMQMLRGKDFGVELKFGNYR